MASFEVWQLVILLSIVVLPQWLHTKKLQSVFWYQRAFPLKVFKDGVITGERANQEWHRRWAHIMFFSGFGEVITVVLFAAGWFYFLYNNQASSLYTPINAMGWVFVFMIKLFPYFFTMTDRYDLTNENRKQIVLSSEPAKKGSKAVSSEVTAMEFNRRHHSKYWLIAYVGLFTLVPMVINLVLITIQNTPGIGQFNRNTVIGFFSAAVVCALTRFIIIIDMVWPGPYEVPAGTPGRIELAPVEFIIERVPDKASHEI